MALSLGAYVGWDSQQGTGVVYGLKTQWAYLQTFQRESFVVNLIFALLFMLVCVLFPEYLIWFGLSLFYFGNILVWFDLIFAASYLQLPPVTLSYKTVTNR